MRVQRCQGRCATCSRWVQILRHGHCFRCGRRVGGRAKSLFLARVAAEPVHH